MHVLNALPALFIFILKIMLQSRYEHHEFTDEATERLNNLPKVTWKVCTGRNLNIKFSGSKASILFTMPKHFFILNSIPSFTIDNLKCGSQRWSCG